MKEESSLCADGRTRLYQIEMLQTRQDVIEGILTLAAIGSIEAKDYGFKGDAEAIFEAFLIDLKHAISCPRELRAWIDGFSNEFFKQIDLNGLLPGENQIVH